MMGKGKGVRGLGDWMRGKGKGVRGGQVWG